MNTRLLSSNNVIDPFAVDELLQKTSIRFVSTFVYASRRSRRTASSARRARGDVRPRAVPSPTASDARADRRLFCRTRRRRRFRHSAPDPPPAFFVASRTRRRRPSLPARGRLSSRRRRKKVHRERHRFAKLWREYWKRSRKRSRWRLLELLTRLARAFGKAPPCAP